MNLNNIIHCQICRKMFQYSGYGSQLCPSCKEKDEEDYKKVKIYLRDNPGRTLIQTSEDCEVSVERIRYWLREERLEYSEAGDTGLKCEHCGRPITSGKMCDECRMAYNKATGEMARSVSRPTIEKPVRNQSKDRMRFLGKR